MAEENEAAQGASAQPSVEELQRQIDELSAERDRAVEQSRKWEGRSKANADKAKQFDELRRQSMTDAERLADAVKRAEKAEAKVAEHERLAARAEAVAEAAAAKGMDAELLARMADDSREEIEANAAWLAESQAARRAYPSVRDDGGKGASRTTKADIEAIKDPQRRVRERAKHIDLYR